MSMQEFLHWTAFLEMEPPDEADNRRTAALLAQITNMAGRSLPKGKTVSVDDFLGKKPQTARDQINFLKGLGGDGS